MPWPCPSKEIPVQKTRWIIFLISMHSPSTTASTVSPSHVFICYITNCYYLTKCGADFFFALLAPCVCGWKSAGSNRHSGDCVCCSKKFCWCGKGQNTSALKMLLVQGLRAPGFILHLPSQLHCCPAACFKLLHWEECGCSNLNCWDLDSGCWHKLYRRLSPKASP